MLLTRIRRVPEFAWVAGFGFFVLALALFSPVTYASSDPFFSLVVSQAILENGDISLDPYQKEAPQLFQELDYQVTEIDGRSYYNFPLGSSFIALPFVWIFQAFGKDMFVVPDNHLLQNVISAFLTSGAFVLAYLVCRIYLPVFASMVITLIFTLGTTLISTGSTAYWNLNATVFLILLALLLLVRYDSEAASTVHPTLLGVLLFAAFFTRPTSAVFIVIVFGYLLFRDRQELVRVCLTAFALLLLFLLFSRLTLGSWLPDYYVSAGRFGIENFGRSLSGVLISPSRGLLIYSPFIIVIIVGMILMISEVRGSILLLLCLIWFILHVLVVSSIRHWWGGFSYGPRLLTDSVPALLIITVILWSQLIKQGRTGLQFGLAMPFILLGIVAISIHSVQGLFNVKTPLWNAIPDIDENSEYLFDWRYPQFLTTRNSFHDRLLNHYYSALEKDPKLIDVYEMGDPLMPGINLNNAFFVGWWFASPDESWTEIETGRILFRPQEPIYDGIYTLEISAGSYGTQVVDVTLNQERIGSVTFSGSYATRDISFEGTIIDPENLNELTLYLPRSRQPEFGDLRDLGLRYWPHQLGLSNIVIKIVPK